MAKSKLQATSLKSDQFEEQLKVLDENWKRALADYQNLAKRVESDKKDIMRFVSTSIISKLIPTLDILEMAATHSQDMGVKMAVQQFQQVLQGEGLQEITPQKGDEFNPVFHEAIEAVPGEQDNSIAEIVTKGYKIGEDFVIRPAKVKVVKSGT